MGGPTLGTQEGEVIDFERMRLTIEEMKELFYRDAVATSRAVADAQFRKVLWELADFALDDNTELLWALENAGLKRPEVPR